MNLILTKRLPDQVDFGLIYGAISLLAILMGRFLSIPSLVPSCVFKGLTGIPCPTCGATRAVVCLSHGDVVGAVIMNPMAALAELFAVFLFFYCLTSRALHAPQVGVVVSEKEKDTMRYGFIALVAANWCYLILVCR